MTNANRIAPDRAARAGMCIVAKAGDPGRRRMLRFALPFVAALAAGCSALPAPKIEDPVLHLLDAQPAIPRAPATRDLVLEVSAPRAAPGYDTAAMAYVQRPYTLDQFAVHRWADAPARMLGPLVVRTLEDAGTFRAVVNGPAGITPDFRLDTELVRLQQDFTAKPSRVELVVRVQMIDVRNRRVVATRVIEETQPAPSDDADGGVAAANAALARALRAVAAFAADAATTPPARPAS
jgi:cholesterol transport system auxiliary component